MARRRKGRVFDSFLSVLVFFVFLLEDTDSTELNRRLLGHDLDVRGDVWLGIDGVWWQEHLSDRRFQRKLHKDEEDDGSGSGRRGARMGEVERGQF